MGHALLPISVTDCVSRHWTNWLGKPCLIFNHVAILCGIKMHRNRGKSLMKHSTSPRKIANIQMHILYFTKIYQMYMKKFQYLTNRWEFLFKTILNPAFTSAYCPQRNDKSLKWCCSILYAYGACSTTLALRRRIDSFIRDSLFTQFACLGPLCSPLCS